MAPAWPGHPSDRPGPRWQRPWSGSRSRWARGTMGRVAALVLAAMVVAMAVSGFYPLSLLSGRLSRAGSFGHFTLSARRRSKTAAWAGTS